MDNQRIACGNGEVINKGRRIMCLVSIIIPIYNSALYLEKCLKSVISQTLTDIEIICVNDGSTDGSAEILQVYALQDNRIVIIEKENGGATSARKVGIERAKGTYIGFMDSDDWIEPEMYERLYEAASQYQTDLVIAGYYMEGNYTTVQLNSVDGGFYDKTGMQWLRNHTIYNMKKKQLGISGSLCCKLFRKDLLSHVQADVPDCIVMSEDKLCLLHYMLHARSAYVIKEAFYHWCIHQESMSHKANPAYLIHVNDVYQYLIRLYEHENFTEQMRTQAELYVTELLVLGINKRLGFYNRELLRIDPYWHTRLPKDAKVVVYGGGDVGEQYLRQMKQRKDISCVAYLEFEMPTKESLLTLEFDYILIAIKNKGQAQQIKEEFTELGVKAEKILWFDQPEVYWKYAEAEGWLDE